MKKNFIFAFLLICLVILLYLKRKFKKKTFKKRR